MVDEIKVQTKVAEVKSTGQPTQTTQVKAEDVDTGINSKKPEATNSGLEVEATAKQTVEEKAQENDKKANRLLSALFGGALGGSLGGLLGTVFGSSNRGCCTQMMGGYGNPMMMGGMFSMAPDPYFFSGIPAMGVGGMGFGCNIMSPMMNPMMMGGYNRRSNSGALGALLGAVAGVGTALLIDGGSSEDRAARKADRAAIRSERQADRAEDSKKRKADRAAKRDKNRTYKLQQKSINAKTKQERIKQRGETQRARLNNEQQNNILEQQEKNITSSQVANEEKEQFYDDYFNQIKPDFEQNMIKMYE